MINLKSWMKRNFAFLAGLVLTLSLLWPLFWSDYFSHHDDVQVIRLFEMNKCIQDGQIPCRWVPDLGGLYGYPLFNYYAPLPYYFGEAFYIISHNLIFSAKVMFAASFLGSYVFMFLLGRRLWGSFGGLLSGVFYSFAPYHAVVFYVRGAMGEMWSLMFFPAVFWAIFRLKETANLGNMLLLSLMVALLSLSHNLSTMLFLPVALVLIAVLAFQEKKMDFLKFSLLSLVLGLTISSFYWVPSLLEKNLAHVETTIEGYFSYTEHFKGLKKLFVERSWGWGASVREVPGGERDGMSFQIGWVHLLGWLLALTSAVRLWKKNRQVSVILLFFSLAAAGSVFMVNPKSEFVWRLVDPLKYLQFPWRFLMLIIFFVSLSLGSVFLWFPRNLKWPLLAVLLVLVVALNVTYFRPEKFLTVTDEALLGGASWDSQIKRSIFDFLPIYAKAPPAELATERFKILSGRVEVANWHEGSNWIKFSADAKTGATVRLSQYYFPDWKVTVDGQETVLDYRNDLGLITFTLDKGPHQVEVRLHNTAVRTASNISTAAGMLTGVGVLLYFMQRKKVRL